VSLEFSSVQVKVILQEAAQIRGGTVFRVGEDLDPIAGRKNHALFNTGVLGESLASVRQPRFRDGKALADLDGSRVVIHADELESHDEANL